MVAEKRKTNTVEKILAATAELFYANGLRGVGIDQVIAESGVAKSTLYVHFRTKDDLVAAYLRRTDDSWMAQLQAAAQRAGDAAGDQLVGLFDALQGAFDRHGFFGCPFVSTGVEAPQGSEAQAITVQHVQRRHRWLTELSSQACADDPQSLARHIGLLIDGALASGRLLQDRTVVDEAKDAAGRLVASHTSPHAGADR